MKWKGLFILILITAFSQINAQQSGLSGLELNYHFGKMIKHTEKITFDPPNATNAIDAKLVFQTNGNQHWHHAHGLPEYGINLLHFDLGNKDILGSATGVFPFINFKIFDNNKLSWNFTFGSGLAYFSKPYDVLENPLNNAIGSKFNNISALRTSLRLKIFKQTYLNVGAAFTHFSNGISKSPNFGFNVASANIGLHYKFHESEERKVLDKASRSAIRSKKLGYEISVGYASKEVGTPGGPNYLVKLANLGLSYRIANVNKILLELAYEFHAATYHFGLQVYAFENKQQARQGATRLALVLGEEFVFGNIAINGKVGFYVSSKSYDLPRKYYVKVGTRYSVPILKEKEIFLAIYLKSHLQVAEYISLETGVRF